MPSIAKMIVSFPSSSDAPLELLLLDGNCGPVTLWGVLKYFKKRASTTQIIEACRHTKKYGAFTIGLAVALHDSGLSVRFYSDPDPNPPFIEARFYRMAVQKDIQIERAISLSSLLSRIDKENIGVVFYNTVENRGHFSPLLGVKDGELVLPYSNEGFIASKKFLKLWKAPEIFRQCLIVSSVVHT